MLAFEMVAVATVRSTRAENRDDNWDAERAVITLRDDLPAEALAGLEAFSHVEIVFCLHAVAPDKGLSNATGALRGARAYRAVPLGSARGPGLAFFSLFLEIAAK